MQITGVKVRRIFDEGAMRAIVSVTLDDVLAIHDIKVICARGKFFIVMPSRKMPDESFRDIVHPVNAEFRALLEEVVLAEYNREAERIRREVLDSADASAGDYLIGDEAGVSGIADAVDAIDAGNTVGGPEAADTVDAIDAVGATGAAEADEADDATDEAPKKRRFFGLGS